VQNKDLYANGFIFYKISQEAYEYLEQEKGFTP
jgi:hypothetical protein